MSVHAHTLTDEELFCLEDCSTYPQYYLMRQRFESEVCGFCVIDTKINTILFENEHWVLFENAFKNDRGCSVMLLIVTRDHFRFPSEVTADAWAALQEMMEWATERYQLPGGMLFMRFGDMRLNAGTVPHLHFNLWVPDESKEVRIPVFKNPDARKRNTEQAEKFAADYEAGVIP